MRWGLAVPIEGFALTDHADLVRALPDLGYSDLWSAESNGPDAFTPLALASVWDPTLRLGTAIVPVFTRGPALIAMSAAAMAAAAPGRFVLGLGASSPAIVHDWNGMDFIEPWRRTRDTLRFIRHALAGERIDGDFESFSIRRFKLENPPRTPPPILLAALRPGMLRLAGREADGAILNWLSPGDVATCRAELGNPMAEVVTRICICPTKDADYARRIGRFQLSTYMSVPAYAAYQDWLGRGEAFGAMADLWAAGDRKGANAAIPDEVVDELFVHGSPESCRERLQDYADAGVTSAMIALFPPPGLDGDRRTLLSILAALGPHA